MTPITHSPAELWQTAAWPAVPVAPQKVHQTQEEPESARCWQKHSSGHGHAASGTRCHGAETSITQSGLLLVMTGARVSQIIILQPCSELLFGTEDFALLSPNWK